MSLTYGFYNSVNHDRVYNAEDMSQIFNGVILDGVFGSVGDTLVVTPNSGFTVNVGTGRAWFNGTWTNNSSIFPITIPRPEISSNRIDAIVLEVNNSIETRANTIKLIKGVGTSKPQLIDNETIHQHALAYITVKPGAEEIKNSDIENVVGTDETPFVSGVVKTASVSYLYSKWEEEFNNWFATLEYDLDEDVAGRLENHINRVERKVDGSKIVIGDILSTKAFLDGDGKQTHRGTWALCNGDEVDLNQYKEEWETGGLKFDINFEKYISSIPLGSTSNWKRTMDYQMLIKPNGKKVFLVLANYDSTVNETGRLYKVSEDNNGDYHRTEYSNTLSSAITGPCKVLATDDNRFVVFYGTNSSSTTEKYIYVTDPYLESDVITKYTIVTDSNTYHIEKVNDYFICHTNNRYLFSSNPASNWISKDFSGMSNVVSTCGNPVFTGNEWLIPANVTVSGRTLCGYLHAENLNGYWSLVDHAITNISYSLGNEYYCLGNYYCEEEDGKKIVTFIRNVNTPRVTTMYIYNITTGNIDTVVLDSNSTDGYLGACLDYFGKNRYGISITNRNSHVFVYLEGSRIINNTKYTNSSADMDDDGKGNVMWFDNDSHERYIYITDTRIYILGCTLPTIDIPGVQTYIKLSETDPEVEE